MAFYWVWFAYKIHVGGLYVMASASIVNPQPAVPAELELRPFNRLNPPHILPRKDPAHLIPSQNVPSQTDIKRRHVNPMHLQSQACGQGFDRRANRPSLPKHQMWQH